MDPLIKKERYSFELAAEQHVGTWVVNVWVRTKAKCWVTEVPSSCAEFFVLSAERKKHIRRLVKTKYGSIASLLDAVLDEEEESVEEIYVRMVANDCKVGTAYIYVSEYEIFQSKAQLIAQAKEEGEYEEG